MAERTPLVAANWKMHKTIAETEAFLDAFLPRAAELGGAELVVCPPYPVAGRGGGALRRERRCGWRRRTCTRSRRARSPARSRPRC